MKTHYKILNKGFFYDCNIIVVSNYSFLNEVVNWKVKGSDFFNIKPTDIGVWKIKQTK